jgi:ClpP class serine protease
MPRAIQAQKWQRDGILMIEPAALRSLWLFDRAERTNTEIGSAVIVDISGPLEQRADFFCDSYEAIIERVREAVAAPMAKAVVLRFDSPGGMAAGCFEAAREIRMICTDAGRQLHAFVEGSCNSAAYALGSVCDSITLGDAGVCGSIGCMSARYDYSAANAADGLRVEIITSGARKADGHPDTAISEAELASTKATIDSIASVFFEHIANHRPSLNVQAITALEAKVLHGQAALAAGLADAVGSLSAVLARIEAGGDGGVMATTAYDKAKAALAEAAKGSDPNALAAKKALAAMGGEGGGEGDEKTEEEKTEPEPEAEPKTETAEPEKKPEAVAAHSEAMRIALAAEARAAKLEAKLALAEEKEERRKLIASRPGLSASMIKLLEKSPMALVRETIADLPATEASGDPINPELETAPTRGDQQVGGPRLSATEKRKLDERMNLAERDVTAQSTPYKLVLGPKPKAAKQAEN